MDKPGANPDMVKAQMAELGLNPVDWGGDVEFVGVSAKAMTGIDELLEAILLQSEVMELKANPDVMAKAVVVESTLEKGGPVATVIVQTEPFMSEIISCAVVLADASLSIDQ